MPLFPSFSISESGLAASRLWSDLIANNIANMNSIAGANGGPYLAQHPVFEEALSKQGSAMGVNVTAIVQDTVTPPTQQYDPSSPYANAQGYVTFSNVNLASEMSDLMIAERMYQANLQAIQTSAAMYKQSITQEV